MSGRSGEDLDDQITVVEAELRRLRLKRRAILAGQASGKARKHSPKALAIRKAFEAEEYSYGTIRRLALKIGLSERPTAKRSWLGPSSSWLRNCGRAILWWPTGWEATRATPPVTPLRLRMATPAPLHADRGDGRIYTAAARHLAHPDRQRSGMIHGHLSYARFSTRLTDLEGKLPAARCGQAPEPHDGAPKARGLTAVQLPGTHSASHLARPHRTCPTGRVPICTS